MLPIDRPLWPMHVCVFVCVCLFNSILSAHTHKHTKIMWLSHSQYFVYYVFISSFSFSATSNGLCVCLYYLMHAHTHTHSKYIKHFLSSPFSILNLWIYSIVFYWCAFQLIAATTAANEKHINFCVYCAHIWRRRQQRRYAL